MPLKLRGLPPITGAMRAYLRSNAIALVALFVALGGTSYAALNMPANSVGTKQLRNGAVTAAKVRKGSLLAKDFKPGQLPRGPQGLAGVQGSPGQQGQKGDPGMAGAPGTARAYALVNTGPGFTGPHPGFTSVVHGAFTGVYCLTPDAGIDPTQYPAVVSPEIAASPNNTVLAAFDRSDNQCSAGQYEVRTFNAGVNPIALAYEGFTIVVP
jgi:hypothetical protein